MEVTKSRNFANGIVHALETHDGYPIEVTDTWLPYYTKDAVGRKQNALKACELGSRHDRWMIGVSVMSGCPIGCKFCATGKLKKWRKLNQFEILEQILFVLEGNIETDPWESKELKINYTRMGEPFLNIEAVRKSIEAMRVFTHGEKIHHYISTIGIKGSDFSWIKDNITLQLSVHSLDEKRRKDLIPYKNLMSLEELGQIRTKSKLKTTVNLTLVDEADFDIEKLKEYFDPKHFFIKLSPINTNIISENNELGEGIIEQRNLL